MKKKILCTMMSMVMVASLFAGCGTDSGKENSASDTSKTKEAGTTISVAAIETAYGSEMWQKVADAFTEETGIKVELTTDKKLEDVIGPSMQGGEYPDVIHLATGREAALTEQFIKGHMITDITDVLSMKVPGEDKLVSEKIAGGFTDTSLTNPYGDGKTYLAPMFYSPCGLFYNAGLLEESRVCTQEGTYQNRCGTSYVIIKSRNLQVSGFPGFLIFYKKTVKHFSLSNPADRHSFPERYDILSGKFLENYFFM